MSREIKFRMWDKTILAWSDSSSTMRIDGQLCTSHPECYQLMQYTGLKDKNEKEIYEGDILDITDYGVGVVLFRSGCFCLEWIDDEEAYIEPIFNILFNKKGIEYKTTVLGNIYENKELLDD